MPIALRDVVVPDFGLPLEAPRIPATTYEKRCREAYARAECDWLVVYADPNSQSLSLLIAFRLLARGRTIARACMTAVDNRSRRVAAA